MCGLAGWFNLDLPDKTQQEELFRLLMRKAQIRGVDSYGIAFKQGSILKVRRGLGPVSRWMLKDRKRVHRMATSSIVIGHTRAASRGDVSVANAHAFTLGGWIGSHNGMISNSSSLMLAARYTPKGETDSEEALSWLVTEGFTPSAFQALQGWFAMTIVKADASEAIIAVDARTPFAVARVGQGLIWHSLGVALEASLAAVGIRAEIEEIKNQIIRLPSGGTASLSALPVMASSVATKRTDAEIDWENDEGHLPFGGGHEQ